MVKEAESNAEADRNRREAVEARNQLDTLVHSTEKTIRDNPDKVPEAEKLAAEQAIAAARTAMEGQDTAAIQAAAEALSQTAMKLGEAMYKAQAEAAPAEEPAPGAKPNEKVVDAEFEEVDPKKKKPQ